MSAQRQTVSCSQPASQPASHSNRQASKREKESKLVGREARYETQRHGTQVILDRFICCYRLPGGFHSHPPESRESRANSSFDSEVPARCSDSSAGLPPLDMQNHTKHVCQNPLPNPDVAKNPSPWRGLKASVNHSPTPPNPVSSKKGTSLLVSPLSVSSHPYHPPSLPPLPTIFGSPSSPPQPSPRRTSPRGPAAGCEGP